MSHVIILLHASQVTPGLENLIIQPVKCLARLHTWNSYHFIETVGYRRPSRQNIFKDKVNFTTITRDRRGTCTGAECVFDFPKVQSTALDYIWKFPHQTYSVFPGWQVTYQHVPTALLLQRYNLTVYSAISSGKHQCFLSCERSTRTSRQVFGTNCWTKLDQIVGQVGHSWKWTGPQGASGGEDVSSTQRCGQQEDDDHSAATLPQQPPEDQTQKWHGEDTQ